MLSNIKLADVDVTKLKSEILKACIIRVLSQAKEIGSTSGYADSPSYNNYNDYSDYGDKYD
jgi:hypothetical protein